MDFFVHLQNYLSVKEVEELKKSLSENDRHAVLLNPMKMNDETFLSIFPHVTKHPVVEHAYLYDKNEYQLGKSIYHSLGCFYLQEPSAMLVSYLLQPKENEVILDLCAAPGGKSAQASFLMHDTGLIVSNDIAKDRAFIISENVERLGLSNLLIVNNDFSKIYQQYPNYFDKIILDAPCSGSGMFRKNEEMEKDWSYNKVIKYQQIQKELILLAYYMLKPGGTLIYSTCSFSKEEDEDVILHLLNNSDAMMQSFKENPLFFVNSKCPYGIHLFPYLFPGEGHYICMVNKPGSSSMSKNVEAKNNKYNLSFNCVDKFNDVLFAHNYDIKVKGLNIIRYGVKVGELIKEEIKYDYHYSHYVKKFDKTYSLNEAEIKKYLRGETINVAIPKGYTLLTYQGINVDIAKSDGRMIKNHLPKGLRKNY